MSMKNTYEHRVVVATHVNSSKRVSDKMNKMSQDGYEVHSVCVTPLSETTRPNLIVTSITFRLRD